MAELFGRTMNKTEILERVGDIAQICDARRMTFSEGRAAGVDTIEVVNGSGLAFTVVPSRCMDISRASYKGMPVAWQSAVGETAPAFYQPEGFEWLRGFFGGLLTTCGMAYSSHPCEDQGEKLGLHGRASNIPAENVAVRKRWDGDDYLISIYGRVREVGVFQDNLILDRTITTRLGSKALTISDTIENAGFTESPLMMLYHINPGWPVVSENSRLVAPVRSSKPFDERARAEIDMWSSFLPPQEIYPERCYLHDMAAGHDGLVRLALVNDKLGIGIGMVYPRAEFPQFVNWKMMGRGTYVVGIEPGNITGNRAAMRADGSLETIGPGEVRSFTIELRVLDGAGEIEAFVEIVEGIGL